MKSEFMDLQSPTTLEEKQLLIFCACGKLTRYVDGKSAGWKAVRNETWKYICPECQKESEHV